MEQLKTLEEKWDLTYHHAMGETAAHFYQTIRDDKKILGRKCEKCGRVLVAPRSYCDRCFADTNEWVEVGLEGKVEAFTVVFQKFEGLPDPPYCIAYVHLDGADTAILNYVKNIDWDPNDVPKELKMGQRVKVVFSDKREGKITDFWFERTIG